MIKKGRPPSDDPKAERITVRLDKARIETLAEYCERESVEKAEAIRRGIDKLKEENRK